ncbi:terpenoid cyclases/Protein prenyltransferase [Rickenella mellea]|uniref:Geranylgeranyl transferase type-2 subunit beta n=1 Tax=Rickenella mellea TaxID=50990 RepID=A0A4Y7PMX9_9AGAM|nr:terpenoid cyclases/Protein prenyltransferase [Rickenella mellea]
MSNELLTDLHVSYIQSLDKHQDDLAYHLTSHLRLNGVYWGLTALCVMNRQDALPRDDMIQFVMSCWDDEAGGFGAHPEHDAHILPTLSAIQILAIQNALDRLDVDRVTKYILSLQNPSGSFSGDFFGETDTRFTYCAVSALSLVGKLGLLDIEKTVAHIRKCRNFDGGFGSSPGAESHAGQVFVCCAALSIMDRLNEVDHDMLAWWLAERQLPNGGLNGRPEKLEDLLGPFGTLDPQQVIMDRLRYADIVHLIRPGKALS